MNFLTGLTGLLTHPFQRFRRWLILVLQDTEEEVPNFAKPATLKEIRDNHLYHLNVRVSRVEAKLGFVLMVLSGLAVTALFEWAGRVF